MSIRVKLVGMQMFPPIVFTRSNELGQNLGHKWKSSPVARIGPLTLHETKVLINLFMFPNPLPPLPSL